MNYGKKSASKKRNSLISRSSMMGKGTCFVYQSPFHRPDRPVRCSVQSWNWFHSWNTCKYAGRK